MSLVFCRFRVCTGYKRVAKPVAVYDSVAVEHLLRGLRLDIEQSCDRTSTDVGSELDFCAISRRT